jgi:hypothetical protein
MQHWDERDEESLANTARLFRGLQPIHPTGWGVIVSAAAWIVLTVFMHVLPWIM